MKKTALLFTLLISFGVATSFAQGVVVTLGNLPVNTTKDGKMVPINTTYDGITKSVKLVTHTPDAQITGYLFSVVVGGKSSQINVKSDQLTEPVLKKLREAKGHDIKVLFDDIKVKTGGVVKTAHPLSFKFDQ